MSSKKKHTQLIEEVPQIVEYCATCGAKLIYIPWSTTGDDRKYIKCCDNFNCSIYRQPVGNELIPNSHEQLITDPVIRGIVEKQDPEGTLAKYVPVIFRFCTMQDDKTYIKAQMEMAKMEVRHVKEITELKKKLEGKKK